MTHETQQQQQDALYPKIGSVVEADGEMPMELDSLCMRCGKNGRTRLLFTQIPFFREVILMSFRCRNCGERNNEIQSGSAVQPRGCKYRLRIARPADLQRQIIKSESATLRLEELDFEVPAGKGVLSTAEGLLHTAVEQLRDSQPDRRRVDAPVADQVEAFLERLEAVMRGDAAALPCTLTVLDPAGNSFVENPHAPAADPQLALEHFVRSPEQQAALGLQAEQYETDDRPAEAEPAQAESAEAEAVEAETDTQRETRRARVAHESFRAPAGATLAGSSRGGASAEVQDKEVFEIPTPCPNCGTEGTSKTCVTDIPFFKEIVIMAFDCASDNCGYRTSEIKGAGAVPARGKLLRLRVAARAADDAAAEERWAADMSRDVVKSNTAGVRVPELDLEVTPGSLGGMYTTVEGLLSLVKETLFAGQAGELAAGDSADAGRRSRFDALEEQFDAILRGEAAFTLEIRDPLANSYVYSAVAPEPEPALDEEEYDRTFEEDDDLGLNDMRTEDYDDGAPAPAPVQPEAPPRIPEHEAAFEGPLEAFAGARPGSVFKLGLRGVGYYEDALEARKAAGAAQTEAQHKMRDLQRDGKQTHPNPDILRNAPTA